MTRIVFALTLGACAATPHAAPHAAPDLDTRVAAAITAAHLYPDGLRCVMFVDEAPDEVAVREVHGGECPGDPAVAPVRDRIRAPASGAALRYDAATDTWAPLAR